MQWLWDFWKMMPAVPAAIQKAVQPAPPQYIIHFKHAKRTAVSYMMCKDENTGTNKYILRCDPGVLSVYVRNTDLKKRSCTVRLTYGERTLDTWSVGHGKEERVLYPYQGGEVTLQLRVEAEGHEIRHTLVLHPPGV